MKIVCLGDSLTSGYGVPAGDCWVSLLNGRGGHEWINAGVAGDTTAGMLARLDGDVLSRKPDTALIMGGCNDIMLLGSYDTAKVNIMAIAHQCVFRGVMPVIGIPLPLHPTEANPWSRIMDLRSVSELAECYSDWLRSFAVTFGFGKADIGGAYRHYIEQRGVASAYLPDGVHPSAEGHGVIAAAVGALIK